MKLSVDTPIGKVIFKDKAAGLKPIYEGKYCGNIGLYVINNKFENRIHTTYSILYLDFELLNTGRVVLNIGSNEMLLEYNTLTALIPKGKTLDLGGGLVLEILTIKGRPQLLVKLLNRSNVFKYIPNSKKR